MLRPYVHYIPVEVRADGSTDIVEQREWAESHPELAANIVKQSTEFAVKHLIPNAGYDCYLAMLLMRYSKLISDIKHVKLPRDARPFPFPE